MIADLDESIRQLLTTEGGFNPAAIDISFEVPNREWSASISRPTINCYLFDVRENLKLRQTGGQLVAHGTRQAGRRPAPFFYDLSYLLTAWTRAAEDEHRLLWHALRTLARFSELPAEQLQGALREADQPISAAVAQPDSVLKSFGEFWTALGNELKPSLTYLVTIPLERDLAAAGPPVLTTSLGVGQRLEQPGHALAAQDFEIASWITGTVRDLAGAPIGGVTVGVEGRALQSVTDDKGRFRLRGLAPGRYRLVARVGERYQQREVDVAAADYDMTLS